MSSADLNAALALESLAAGVAVPRAGVGHLLLAPQPLVLSVVGMAGEQSCVWGFHVGHLSGRGTALTEGDPRRWGDQHRLWRRLGTALRPWRQRISAVGLAPQLVVANPSVVRLLDAASLRFRNDDNDDVRLAAETVRFLVDRADLAGQQGLVVATDLVREHWAFGTADSTDHLPSVVAWLDGLGDDAPGDLTRARGRASTVLTDPSLDAAVLGHEVGKYNDALRTGSGAASARARRAGGPVVSLLGAQHGYLSRIMNTYRTTFATSAPVAAAMADLDARAFHDYLRRRGDGMRLTRTESPRRAAIALVERMERDQAWKGALLAEDPVQQIRGILDGEVLEGTVSSTSGTSVTVTTTTEVLRLRPGQYMTTTTGLRGEVVEVLRDAGGYSVEFTMSRRMAVTPMAVGDAIVMLPQAPSVAETSVRTAKVAQRLRSSGWLFDLSAPAPTTGTRSVRPGLASEVEALRGAP